MLDGLVFPKLSDEDNQFLISPITKEYVKDEIWGYDGYKSLGLDGFIFSFIKEC